MRSREENLTVFISALIVFLWSLVQNALIIMFLAGVVSERFGWGVGGMGYVESLAWSAGWSMLTALVTGAQKNDNTTSH